MNLVELENIKNIYSTFEERIDISNINIDINENVYNRIHFLLKQIKNPYAYKCGEIAVNVIFNKDGVLLKDAITCYLKNKNNFF